MPFRLRDALRDLVRAPGAATLVIAAALALAIAPLVVYTLAASRAIAAAGEGHAAFKIYQTWCVIAIVGGAIAARAAAALIASTWVARADRGSLGLGESVARALLHGVPALLTAALAIALVGLGLIAVVVPGFALAAITFAAAPAAAAERLAPGAAIRRSAALTRGARLRLVAWSLGALVVQLSPFVVARVTMLAGKKPPVAPILHMQQLQGWLVIAAAIAGALVQVSVYRRLRDSKPAA